MAKSNVWMSVSDLMTGLMIIFLFVAVSYMVKVQSNQKELESYVKARASLYETMVEEFAGDTIRWQMSIGKDLTLKFKNTDVLFERGEADLTDEFKMVLDEFLPKYFDILLNDTMRYYINEIRVEGHTDVDWKDIKADPYIENTKLAQQRALSVVKYFRESEVFRNYSEDNKELIEFWLSANGLSYGRAVDSDGNYVMISKKPVDNAKSRRVEFRVVTSADKVIENWEN